MTNAFDFAPLLPRRPARPRGQIHRPAEIQFHRRQQRPRPTAARRAGRRRRCGADGARAARSRPTGSTAARRATGRCASFSSPSSRPMRASPAPPTTSSSRRARCRRSISSTATLLERGDTVIIEEDCYQGSINRLARLGVERRSAFRSTATACAWMRSRDALDDLKRKGVRPKYIYTIPTVQNPTAHHPAGGARARKC